MSTEYIDKRGWRYKVFPGIGEDCYKARYQKPGRTSWNTVRQLPWRDTQTEAEADLARYAEKKQMRKDE